MSCPVAWRTEFLSSHPCIRKFRSGTVQGDRGTRTPYFHQIGACPTRHAPATNLAISVQPSHRCQYPLENETVRVLRVLQAGDRIWPVVNKIAGRNDNESACFTTVLPFKYEVDPIKYKYNLLETRRDENMEGRDALATRSICMLIWHKFRSKGSDGYIWFSTCYSSIYVTKSLRRNFIHRWVGISSCSGADWPIIITPLRSFATTLTILSIPIRRCCNSSLFLSRGNSNFTSTYILSSNCRFVSSFSFFSLSLSLRLSLTLYLFLFFNLLYFLTFHLHYIGSIPSLLLHISLGINTRTGSC